MIKSLPNNTIESIALDEMGKKPYLKTTIVYDLKTIIRKNKIKKIFNIL